MLAISRRGGSGGADVTKLIHPVTHVHWASYACIHIHCSGGHSKISFTSTDAESYYLRELYRRHFYKKVPEAGSYRDKVKAINVNYL